MSGDLYDAALDLPCPYCDASPDYWCQTASGKRAALLHSARTTVLQAGWRVGYGQGQYYMARNYFRAPERFEEWATEVIRRYEAEAD